MTLALLRSPGWEWALLFHVVGALLLVGGMTLVTVVAVRGTLSAASERAVALRRLGLRAMLFLVIPSFLLTRISGEWVRSQDAFPDDQAWIDIGYTVTEPGALIIAAATLLAWRATRTAERTGSTTSLSGRLFAVLPALYLVALLVAVWAMTTKPA